MPRRKPKKEWHLYSAVAITSTVTFIGASYFTGTSQVIGCAFAGIVGMFLFASNNWKMQDTKIHIWSVIISITIFIFIIGFNLLINSKKHFQIPEIKDK
jgi:hypothetical protein